MSLQFSHELAEIGCKTYERIVVLLVFIDIIRTLRPEANSQKVAPKHGKTSFISCVQYMVLKRGPWLRYSLRLYQRREPLYFALAIQKLYSLKAR